MLRGRLVHLATSACQGLARCHAKQPPAVANQQRTGCWIDKPWHEPADLPFLSKESLTQKGTFDV